MELVVIGCLLRCIELCWALGAAKLVREEDAAVVVLLVHRQGLLVAETLLADGAFPHIRGRVGEDFNDDFFSLVHLG